LQHVRELIVAGRTIVKDGTILGADLPAARAQVLDTMRSGMKAGAPLAAAMPALDRVMARHFEPHAHCC
jgi:hypothetical protein